MNSYKEELEKTSGKIDEYFDYVFSHGSINEKDSDAELKVRNAKDEMMAQLIKCQTASDIAEVCKGYEKILAKHGVSGKEGSVLKAQCGKVVKFLAKSAIEKPGKALGHIAATVLMLGVAVAVTCAGLEYKFPGFLEKAKDCAETIYDTAKIVKRTCGVVIELKTGQTVILNTLTDQNAAQSKELAEWMRKNETALKSIDEVLHALGKIMNATKSKEEIGEEMVKLDDEVRKISEISKKLKSVKTEDEANAVVGELQANLDQNSPLYKKVSASDSFTQSAKESFLKAVAGIKTVNYHIKKAVVGDDKKSNDEKTAKEDKSEKKKTDKNIDERRACMEFRRQRRILSEAIASYGKLMLTESFDRKEAKIHKVIYDIWKNTEKNVRNPDDVKDWYFEHKQDIIDMINDKKISSTARKSLKQAFSLLSVAVEGHPYDHQSFIRRHWLKILVLICYIALFLLGGFMCVGTVAIDAGAASALEGADVVAAFLTGGWSLVWHAFVTMLTAIGLGKLGKWWLFGRK